MARIPSKAAAVLGAAASIALLSAPWASASTSGTQRFVLTTRSTAANPVYQAAATGVITATGTMQATSTASSAPLKAKFPKGTFLLNEVSAGHETGTINPSTCAAVYSDTGIKYTISSGTGSYKGITGSGTAIQSRTRSSTKFTAISLTSHRLVASATQYPASRHSSIRFPQANRPGTCHLPLATCHLPLAIPESNLL